MDQLEGCLLQLLQGTGKGKLGVEIQQNWHVHLITNDYKLQLQAPLGFPISIYVPGALKFHLAVGVLGYSSILV